MDVPGVAWATAALTVLKGEPELPFPPAPIYIGSYEGIKIDESQ